MIEVLKSVVFWSVITFFALGELDVIDFHVCIKMPGECSVEVTK